MKIAILGGRFDPPHLGHLQIARQVLEFQPDIDKIIFIPVFKHHWSPIEASPKDRVTMLKSFLPPKMEVSDVEIKRRGISYTIDTIKEIKRQTKAEIYWIIGSDILSEFNKWKNSNELIKLAKFLVFPRPGHTLPKKLPVGFKKIDSANLLLSDISSTKIRKMIKNKKSIRNLVPEEVEKYIIEHKLYVK